MATEESEGVSVSLPVAYAEACLALGEEVVKSRLMDKELGRLLGELKAAKPVEGGLDDQGDGQGGSPPDNQVPGEPS